MTTTLATSWLVPSAAISHTLSIVADPDLTVAETNEFNNQYTLTTTLPALVVENVGLYYGSNRTAYPIVMVRNQGVLTATNVAVELYRDAITGTLLLADQITTLGPGALGAVTTTLNAVDFPHGVTTLVAVADPANAIVEFGDEENLGDGVLQSLPDLVVRVGDVVTAAQGSDTLVTVTVYNQGVAAAGAFTITVSAGNQIADDAPVLATIAVVALAPDGVATLTAVIPGQPEGIYVFVDRENSVGEIENGNNVAWAISAP